MAPTSMNSLRWTLLVITLLVAASAVTLFALAKGFRASFGASANSPLKIVVPLAVLGILAAALAFPDARILLHLGAIVVAGLVIGCFWLFRRAPYVSMLSLAYLGAWLSFYYKTLQSAPP